MKVKVFVSESRVSRKKYVEDMKPRERMDYLKKYPRSSFKKITDNKGKIVEAGSQPQPKKKPSGKPAQPKPTARKRSAISQRSKKQIVSGVTNPRARKAVSEAIDKINSGTANARNLNTIKKHVDEDTAAKLDKAFALSKKRAKADVESRRQEMSEPAKPSGKKKVTKKNNTQEEDTPKQKPKKKVTRKPAKKPAQTEAPKEDAEANKPTPIDAAKVIQGMPKTERSSMLDTFKRVFGKSSTQADVDKLEKARKASKDKVSRETLDKLKRYAEAGVIGKKKKPEQQSAKTRKKLTKMQMYDRIKENDLPKVEEYRNKARELETEFRNKAQEIRDGKGTKEERIKKITSLRDNYQKRINRQMDLARKKSKAIRDNIEQIRSQSDRADGERKKK